MTGGINHIRVEFIGVAKERFGTDIEHVQVRPGTTIGELLGEILGLDQESVNTEGFIILHNGHGIGPKEEVKVVLQPGDEITILPMLGGG
ncbi:MAG: MoaD/ThiS family protein [Thermoanaerobacteraceae bacterium]|nr:MoaD/ThiS family protein [Thermoanaerobacteraceae bacterium]